MLIMFVLALFFFLVLVALLTIVLLFSISYTKVKYGSVAEYLVACELNRLPQNEYIVLNDIMIKDSKGTHQIDHIVISKYGIFVIETKGYQGLIVGNVHKDNWYGYYGKKKFLFHNPIHQNYGHIQALKEVLKLEENMFISIVCFSNEANLKIGGKIPIVKIRALINVITAHKTVLLQTDLINLKQKLLNLNITDNETRSQHVTNIRNEVKEKEIKVNNLICPKCSGKLIERSGKYGEFLGCSNYPKCKYTQKIN